MCKGERERRHGRKAPNPNTSTKTILSGRKAPNTDGQTLYFYQQLERCLDLVRIPLPRGLARPPIRSNLSRGSLGKLTTAIPVVVQNVHPSRLSARPACSKVSKQPLRVDPEWPSHVDNNAISYEPIPILLLVEALEVGQPRIRTNDHANTADEDGIRVAIRRRATQQHVVWRTLKQFLLTKHHLASGLVEQNYAVSRP